MAFGLKNSFKMNFIRLNIISLTLVLLFCALEGQATPNSEIRKLADYTSFIKIRYKESAEYTSGFGNTYRNGILNIKKGDAVFQATDNFTVKPNEIIEVYFSNPIQNLSNFFAYKNDTKEGDTNNEKILSVDFSNFDSSLIEDISSMFYGCSSIEEIDFTTFKTSGKISDISNTFNKCQNLKSIDLSQLNITSVANMNNIFKNCNSLIYLDISNFNLKNLEKAEEAFYGLSKLKYINIFFVQTNQVFNNSISQLKGKDGLIVCQNEQIISDVINKCCLLYKETSSCSPSNYIIAKFNKEVNYPYGFGYIEYDKTENQYRNESYLVKYKGKTYKSDEALQIEVNSEVDIIFNSTLTSLKRFFYSYYDPNVENIISLDLTYFNSSLLESIDSAFSGCTSLEYINLSNFKAPLLTNMNSAFFHCSSLKALDLSNIISTSITSINRMLCGCASLMCIFRIIKY